MTMLDGKCDVCGRPEPIGVASTSIPYSCAFCTECLQKGADPELVFEYFYSEDHDIEKWRDPDLSVTWCDGRYMTMREWFARKNKEASDGQVRNT